MKNHDIKVNFPISFLWDKWKYHDSLAYSRWTSSLTFEVAVFGATGLTLKVLFEAHEPIRLCLLCFLSLAWILASRTSYSFIKSQAIDVRVRNTFNKQIVEQLLEVGLLEGDKETWRFQDYNTGSRDDNKHPINLWHTPKPFDEGRDTRATKLNAQLMKIFFRCNLVVASLFVLSTIFFIHLYFS